MPWYQNDTTANGSRPARAGVSISRRDGKVRVRMDDFVSTTTITRLGMEAEDVALFGARIVDRRSVGLRNG
jgi:hypothetical protein